MQTLPRRAAAADVATDEGDTCSTSFCASTASLRIQVTELESQVLHHRNHCTPEFVGSEAPWDCRNPLSGRDSRATDPRACGLQCCLTYRVLQPCRGRVGPWGDSRSPFLPLWPPGRFRGPHGGAGLVTVSGCSAPWSGADGRGSVVVHVWHHVWRWSFGNAAHPLPVSCPCLAGSPALQAPARRTLPFRRTFSTPSGAASKGRGESHPGTGSTPLRDTPRRTASAPPPAHPQHANR